MYILKDELPDVKKRKLPITVSVSMVVYNHGKFLRKALDSILMQEVNFRYQIVVGEDASNDDSKKILLEYAKRYPGYFLLLLHEKNVGIQENVRSKLPYLTGEFIAPLEGDDYWTDCHKLQKQVDFLRDHPDFSAVSHQAIVVDEEERILPQKSYNRAYCQESEFTRKHFEEYLMPGQTGTMLFRNYWQQFTPKQKEIYGLSTVMGDRKRTLATLFTGRVYCMEERMSAYRRHPDSWNGVERPGGSSCYQYFESFELEKLARQLFSIEMDFTQFRFRAWFGTVIYLLGRPSPENLQAVWRVWNHNGRRCQKLIFLFIHTLFYPVRKTLRFIVVRGGKQC